MDEKSHKKIYGKEDLDFGDTPEKLRGDYIDIYKGIQSKVIRTTRFDENSDLSTTYLGKIDIT